MFNDVIKYREISDLLAKNIEIYESSYEVFEKAIDFSTDVLSSYQEKILRQFLKFCHDEDINVTDERFEKQYGRIKKIIVSRVHMMKREKESNDAVLEIYEQLDTLEKEGTLSEKTKNDLIKQAEEKYTTGSRRYNEYLHSLINETKESVAHDLNKKLVMAKKNVKSIHKGNNIGNVMLSAIEPIGYPFYNAYATIHNANTKLRTQHKFANAVAKLGMTIAATAGIASIATMAAVSPIVTLIAVPCIIGYTATTIKHLFSSTDNLEILRKKRSIGSYGENFKEMLLRYRKQKGKFAIKTKNKLYGDVDRSKTEDNDDMFELHDSEKEKNEDNVVAQPINKDELKTLPSGDFPMLEASKIEDVDKGASKDEEPNPVDYYDEKSDTEDYYGERTKTDTDDHEAIMEAEKPIVSEFKSESTEEDRQDSEQEVISSSENKEKSDMNANNNDIYDITDVNNFLVELRSKGSLTSVDDYIKLRNVISYLRKNDSKPGYHDLRNMFMEFASKSSIPEDVQGSINTYKAFNKQDKTIEDDTTDNRKKAYNDLVEYILNAPLNVTVNDKYNFFVNHYSVTNSEVRELQTLLANREKKVLETVVLEKSEGRGK